jgi:hypothetical protein
VTEERFDPIRWEPRVSPALIRRLYETDARGIVDEDLIDEVGYALLARCETIRRVTGRCCPRCGERPEGAYGDRRDRPMHCPSCDWRSTWERYHRSYKRDRIHGGRAFPYFMEFRDEFPRCRSPREKMLAIDRLIHAVHESLTKQWTLPAAVNLIQGKRDQIIELLDALASPESMCPERREVRTAYFRKLKESQEPTRRHIEAVQERKRR